MDFSVRTGTLLHRSHLPLRKWVFAIYLICRPKGIASTQLARDLGITQKTAWYVGHRIRQACLDFERMFMGSVEVDETFVGGKKKNKHRVKRQRFKRGTGDKIPVIGVYERGTKKVKTKVLGDLRGDTLRKPIYDWVYKGTSVHSDEKKEYKAISSDYYHSFVRHSLWQYVKGKTHTNGLENFWSLFKRGYMGTYHVMSPKHLWRYVREFTARHNARPLGVYGFMVKIAQGLRGQRLQYQELIA
ncbi:MAG: IS1595 family transposase [Gemmatimonadetes bacterium]|nr:IS1595 family transposase [Gemmatimonadota bacterium]